jgi:hypothetical protein
MQAARLALLLLLLVVVLLLPPHLQWQLQHLHAHPPVCAQTHPPVCM